VGLGEHMDIILVVAFLTIFLSALVTPTLTFLIFSKIEFTRDRENHNVHKDYMTAKGRLA
jgi:hypothetical protein